MNDKNSACPVYDSDRNASPFIQELLELYRYRELIALFVSRNLKVRYKRSFLGVAWTMLNPLLMMAIMTLIFSTLFRFTLPNYPVYVLSGFIFWTFFSQTTSFAMSELVWGGALLTRIYVPRGVFAATALGTCMVNLLLSLVPLFGIMLVMGAPFKATLLFLPVGLLLLAMFSLGIGLFLSTLAVFFVDVLEMYQVVLMAWMYFTPIIYPLDIIPAAYQWVFLLNPMYYFLEVFRLPLYEGRLPSLEILGLTAIMAIAALLVGWWVFTRKVDEFAYRV